MSKRQPVVNEAAERTTLLCELLPGKKIAQQSVRSARTPTQSASATKSPTCEVV
jgi:hypothetical protein